MGKRDFDKDFLLASGIAPDDPDVDLPAEPLYYELPGGRIAIDGDDFRRWRILYSLVKGANVRLEARCKTLESELKHWRRTAAIVMTLAVGCALLLLRSAMVPR